MSSSLGLAKLTLGSDLIESAFRSVLIVLDCCGCSALADVLLSAKALVDVDEVAIVVVVVVVAAAAATAAAARLVNGFDFIVFLIVEPIFMMRLKRFVAGVLGIRCSRLFIDLRLLLITD